MAYMALYRKWRPMTFEEVVEQSPVVTVLRNAVISGRIAHAYLFCGTRGTGKTTMAKIFARAVNCLNPQNGSPCNECDVCRNILNQQILDVSEIDAASNNGVDNIRAIIEETAYAAFLKGIGVSEKRIPSIIKVTDLNAVELEGDKVKDAEKLTESVKTEWADFIETSNTNGANTNTPPANNQNDGDDPSKMTMEQYIAYRNKN
mgnify:CR=1 FL=1